MKDNEEAVFAGADEGEDAPLWQDIVSGNLESISKRLYLLEQDVQRICSIIPRGGDRNQEETEE